MPMTIVSVIGIFMVHMSYSNLNELNFVDKNMGETIKLMLKVTGFLYFCMLFALIPLMITFVRFIKVARNNDGAD